MKTARFGDGYRGGHNIGADAPSHRKKENRQKNQAQRSTPLTRETGFKSRGGFGFLYHGTIGLVELEDQIPFLKSVEESGNHAHAYSVRSSEFPSAVRPHCSPFDSLARLGMHLRDKGGRQGE